mmetsp:Transcript_22873/g.71263  ORF Transcript_22873/g.71263 Transcript_22873/m.71263 type:complete len:258 (-) Transcript_22873:148-921(-)
MSELQGVTNLDVVVIRSQIVAQCAAVMQQQLILDRHAAAERQLALDGKHGPVCHQPHAVSPARRPQLQHCHRIRGALHSSGALCKPGVPLQDGGIRAGVETRLAAARVAGDASMATTAGAGRAVCPRRTFGLQHLAVGEWAHEMDKSGFVLDAVVPQPRLVAQGPAARGEALAVGGHAREPHEVLLHLDDRAGGVRGDGEGGEGVPRRVVEALHREAERPRAVAEARLAAAREVQALPGLYLVAQQRAVIFENEAAP